MTVAIPLLNGVPPESEYLRCAPSRMLNSYFTWRSIPCGSVCCSLLSMKNQMRWTGRSAIAMGGGFVEKMATVWNIY